MDNRPLLRLSLSELVDLRLLEDADVPELQALIEANREHLARWMPWAAGQSLEDSRRFIRRSRAQLTANDGLQAAIVIDDAIAGVIGFHAIDWSHRSTSIGYWLAEALQGRGLMTEPPASRSSMRFEPGSFTELRSGLPLKTAAARRSRPVSALRSRAGCARLSGSTSATSTTSSTRSSLRSGGREGLPAPHQAPLSDSTS